MKSAASKVSLIGVLVSTLTLAFGATASAHVVVKPAEVATAGFQTFTVGVPNEKDISTISVKLVIPDGLEYVQPTQKAGWQITIEPESSTETTGVKSITWHGNEIKTGFRDDFTFSGRVPGKASELQWKAYQTYSDGTVVSWDKAAGGDDHDNEEDSGPFSVTKVVAETASETALNNVEQAATDADSVASTALYVGIGGVVVGLIGVFLASRKK